MSKDLTRFLNQWPYEPGKINVRLIEGEDGEPRLQLRLDLGVLQLHTTGRPDGRRPHGCDSLLEYHEQRLDEHAAQVGSEEGFSLSEDDCRQLREEAVQYYHRYVCLFVLNDFDGVVRDTSRNLRLLDFCAKHAEQESDKKVLEQFRAYIMMMRARALATQAMKNNETKAALHAIDQGLAGLRAHFEQIGTPELFEQSNEAQILTEMRTVLTPKLPVSQHAELRHRLDQAIAQENYELAAILRDELRQITTNPPRAE